jgi:hypothetical protein
MGNLSHTHTYPTCSPGAFGTISSTQVNMMPPRGAGAGGEGGDGAAVSEQKLRDAARSNYSFHLLRQVVAGRSPNP